MTTREMIALHNELAEGLGLTPLNGWKASKEALQARIDGLMTQQPSDPLALTEADKPTVTFETEENANPDPLDLETVQDLGDPEPDEVPPSVAEEATDDHGEPAEHPEAKGGIGKLIGSLLIDPEGFDYPTIVEMVKGEFPGAATSARSVASVAAGLRRKGIDVPMRRKAPKADA